MPPKVTMITARRAPRPCTRPNQDARHMLRVSAEVHDDDFMLQVPFDAAPWFQQASDDKIRALAGIEWGGNVASDEVARFACSYDKDVESLFGYLRLRVRGGKEGGFECHVAASDAQAWCAAHRPHLFPQGGDDA